MRFLPQHVEQFVAKMGAESACSEPPLIADLSDAAILGFGKRSSIRFSPENVEQIRAQFLATYPDAEVTM